MKSRIAPINPNENIKLVKQAEMLLYSAFLQPQRAPGYARDVLIPSELEGPGSYEVTQVAPMYQIGVWLKT